MRDAMSAPATKSYISDWAFKNQTFLHKYLKNMYQILWCVYKLIRK